MYAIEIIDFVKKYGKVNAVNGVNLLVEAGELFGLIGPDGAGKTTLLRSICTLLKPTSGQIMVTGKNALTEIGSIRRILGYMPQRFSLYQDLTAEQNLLFFADLFQVPRSEREKRLPRLYSFSKLEPFKNRLAGQLSGGMKQKLALSCALIHTPEILILDEPTYGVDPLSRQEFWEILKSIQQEGTTILVSTAYMEEAELCDRIALMHKGKIVRIGNPLEIRQKYPNPVYRVTAKNLADLKEFFKKQELVQQIHLFGNAIHLSFSITPADDDWKKWQQRTAGNLTGWTLQTASIEDVFMDIISQEKG
jgi:drug efflux transport system ATP-binding protein